MKARRRTGQLLIELSVAVAVSIAAMAATLATVQSTAKTGREIELMNQMVSDVTTFAAHDNNLHLMGGPNFLGNTGVAGDLGNEYMTYLQRNYPFNTITATAAPAVGTTRFAGFMYITGLGTASALTTAAGAPAGGSEVFFVEGGDTNATGGTTAGNGNTIMVLYAYVPAPLAFSLGTAAGTTTPYTTAAATAPTLAGNPNNNFSHVSESVQAILAEDANTGIVAIATPFSFGSLDFLTGPGGVGVQTNAGAAPYLPGAVPGAAGQSVGDVTGAGAAGPGGTANGY